MEEDGVEILYEWEHVSAWDNGNTGPKYVVEYILFGFDCLFKGLWSHVLSIAQWCKKEKWWWPLEGFQA